MLRTADALAKQGVRLGFFLWSLILFRCILHEVYCCYTCAWCSFFLILYGLLASFSLIYFFIYRKKKERNVFNLARTRERRTTSLDHVICIKSDSQKVLVKDNYIKKMWREYFNKASWDKALMMVMMRGKPGPAGIGWSLQNDWEGNPVMFTIH